MDQLIPLIAELWAQFNGPSFLGGILAVIGGLYYGPDRLSAMFNKSSEVALAAHKALDEASDQVEEMKDPDGNNDE